MTKPEQAAKMRAGGASIEAVMERFGWKRKTAIELSSKGKNWDRHRDWQTAYQRSLKYLVRKRERHAAQVPDCVPIPALHVENREATAERNRRIIAMVEAGATYSEAAAAQGVTRNAVAGICVRNGVVSRSDQEAIARRAKIIAEANAKYARKRSALIKKLHADPAWKIQWRRKMLSGVDRRCGRNSDLPPQI